MSNLSPVWFPLDSVEDRVHAKYAVARPDARLAVDYLAAFVDARMKRVDQDIILPQIADWAWHELVLDTAQYGTLCHETFGRFLNHVARPVSSEGVAQFARSMRMMRDDYGLGLGSQPEEWLDAGWSRPRYRLRQSLPASVIANAVCDSPPAVVSAFAVDLLSWLPDRLMRRFGIPLRAARRGVLDYALVFGCLTPESAHSPHDCSLLGQVAWEEHLLWTERYASDCDRELGHFLDHLPRLSVLHDQTIHTMKAA